MSLKLFCTHAFKVILLFALLLPQLLFAQRAGVDTSMAKIQRVYYQRQLNVLYNQTYQSFAPVTWITPPFCEVLGPRYYLITVNLQPYFLVLGAKWSRVAISLEPRVALRVMRGTSSPVRTPSFNPGSTIYVRLLNDTTHLFYFTTGLFHHSNGQDGPTLDTALAEPRKMNTYNGSFATNYYTVGLNYAQQVKAGKLNYNMNGRAEVEHHVFGIDTGLKGRFGNVRLNLKFTAIALGKGVETIKLGRKRKAILREDDRVEMFRLTFAASFILDKFTGPQSASFARRVNVEAYAMYRIPGSPNVSVFGGGGYY